MTANCIRRLSNSSKLMQMFNKAALCFSTCMTYFHRDTLDRFLEEVKESRSANNKLSTLHKSSFTILSVDNVDVLASYAAVTSKGFARSWHGTSIMAQQTKPSELLSDVELLSGNKTSDFSNINIFGDGACFYRCLAVFGDSNLLKCPRNSVGLPTFLY